VIYGFMTEAGHNAKGLAAAGPDFPMGIFKQRCAMPIKQTKPGIYMELGQFLDLIEWEALFCSGHNGFHSKMQPPGRRPPRVIFIDPLCAFKFSFHFK